jgi:hypothetical protein
MEASKNAAYGFIILCLGLVAGLLGGYQICYNYSPPVVQVETTKTYGDYRDWRVSADWKLEGWYEGVLAGLPTSMRDELQDKVFRMETPKTRRDDMTLLVTKKELADEAIKKLNSGATITLVAKNGQPLEKPTQLEYGGFVRQSEFSADGKLYTIYAPDGSAVSQPAEEVDDETRRLDAPEKLPVTEKKPTDGLWYHPQWHVNYKFYGKAWHKQQESK